MRIAESLVDQAKRERLRELLASTDGIHGDIAEVGVYKGGTAQVLVAGAGDSHVYLFDTFAGMPEHDQRLDGRWRVGSFADTSEAEVRELFAVGNDDVTVAAGVFPQDTGHLVEGCTFRFVHLDVDNHGPYTACLGFFYARMAVGGVIVFDDYGESCCPGARIAVDEFFAGREPVVIDGTAYVVKQ